MATENINSLNIAVLTVSDTRSLENDKSGDYLASAVAEAGHKVVARDLVKDDIYVLRAIAVSYTHLTLPTIYSV